MTVAAFATARTEGYTSNNKHSKSILAPPSSLIHDTDCKSNYTVLNGKNTDLNNGNTDSKIETNLKEQGDNLKSHLIDGNVNDGNMMKNDVLLSSNGRVLSANNKHSFSVKDANIKTISENTEISSISQCNNINISMMKDGEESRNNDSSFIRLGTRARNGDVNTKNENENENENGESKVEFITENKNEKMADKKPFINDEKRLRRETERENKFKSKTYKWTEFTSWIESLIAGNDDSNIIGKITASETERNENKSENNVTKTCNKSSNINNLQTHAERTPRSCTYDVIVDGANVGYYKQNFNGAPTHIDYRQVDWMVKQLSCRGTYVLLFIFF